MKKCLMIAAALTLLTTAAEAFGAAAPKPLVNGRGGGGI